MEELQQEILSMRSELLGLKQLILRVHQPQPKFISAKETMEMLGCNRNTFNRLRDEGILKVYRLKRLLYCKHSEVVSALENGLIHVNTQKKAAI